MIRRLLDNLTSRRTSVALMIFVAVAGTIGAWVPQRINTPPADFEAWQADSPVISGVSATLGFDRLFATWWFLAVLAVFLLSLSIATWRMIATAVRRTRREPAPPRSPLPGASLANVTARARAAGFRQHSLPGGIQMLVRHRLGLWGTAVMHAGMVVAILAALGAAAFTSRGVLDMSAGEVFEPGGGYLVTEGGILSSPPDLGLPLRLDELTTEVWPTGELRSVAARVSVLDETGTWVPYTSAANHPLRLFGHTIYVQPGEFGDAAFVTLRDAGGTETRIRMEFTFVPEGTVGYSDFALPGGSSIEARWDPHGVRGDGLLALRLVRDETTQPVVLAQGEIVELGDYDVEFAERSQWARLIIVRPYAIGALFAGFAVIGLGSLMIYVWVPRELILAQEPDGIRYTWRATRMPRSFDQERDAILGIEREENA